MAILIDLSSVTPIVQGMLESNYSHNITRNEVAALGLTGSYVRTRIAEILGKSPDRYWFSDPTNECPTNHSIFDYYKWTPLKVGIRFKEAAILSVDTRTDIVVDNFCENKSDFPSDFETVLSKKVTNTCSHTYSSSNSISVSATIGVKVAGYSASLSSEYQHTWGQSQTNQCAVELGIQSSVKIPLPPHSSAHALLEANISVVKVKVTYEAYLCGGGIALEYQDWYQAKGFPEKHKKYYLYASSFSDRQALVTDTMTISNFNQWRTNVRQGNILTFGAAQDGDLLLASSDLLIGEE